MAPEPPSRRRSHKASPDTIYILDEKVRLYRRPRSRFWQCAAFIGGRDHRESTKQEELLLAKEFAMGWYMEKFTAERKRQRGEDATAEQPSPRAGTGKVAIRHLPRRRKPGEPSFEEVSKEFTADYELLTQGERNANYVKRKSDDLRVHILPFLGSKGISTVTGGLVQEYRVHRMTSRVSPRTGEILRPSRTSLHHEIVTIRQVLKHAYRKGLIAAVPDLSAPYKQSGKVSHRGWFSPEEYKMLYQATRERSETGDTRIQRNNYARLHDYILFMANTGLRPDEASRLEFRDIKIVKDQDNGGRILEIAVRGKRGTGYCKSMPGAVLPFERVRKRADNPHPTAYVWGEVQRQLLNDVLRDLNLKTDREGQPRTAYSLRHTYISMRLMEGADIYQIAKNCRTSVEMIEKHYARHIQNTIDTAAINVRRKRSMPAPRRGRAQERKADKSM